MNICIGCVAVRQVVCVKSVNTICTYAAVYHELVYNAAHIMQLMSFVFCLSFVVYHAVSTGYDWLYYGLTKEDLRVNQNVKPQCRRLS